MQRISFPPLAFLLIHIYVKFTLFVYYHDCISASRKEMESLISLNEIQILLKVVHGVRRQEPITSVGITDQCCIMIADNIADVILCPQFAPILSGIVPGATCDIKPTLFIDGEYLVIMRLNERHNIKGIDFIDVLPNSRFLAILFVTSDYYGSCCSQPDKML